VIIEVGNKEGDYYHIGKKKKMKNKKEERKIKITN